MKHYDETLTLSARELLQSLVGCRLNAYLTTEEENRASSYGLIILRLDQEDVEVRTREIVGTVDWFDETNTVDFISRPLRDSSSPFSNCMHRLEDGSLKEESCAFHESSVNRQITEVAVVIATNTYDVSQSSFDGEPAKGSYIQALILYFDDDALVFDKGAESWSEIWTIQRCKRSQVQLAERMDYDIYPYIQTSTRVETFK